MKVVFVAPKSNFSQELLDKLKKHADIYFFEESPIDIRNISLLKKPGDKILCPFPEPMDWKFPNDYLKNIPDLKAICLSTTSYHWVDGKLARTLGIDLTNVPNVPNGVAEAAIFAMFAVARRYAVACKENKFEFIPNNFLQETTGKTMGIVGLGKIGNRIAELGKSLGLQVVYWSRKSRNKGYQYVSLDRLFKTADFIFPALVLNKDTGKSVSKKLINLIKPTASVIASVNGGIVDMDYLLKKVKDKKIYGCALEDDRNIVAEYEGNVFVMLHNNWYTKETIETKMKIWVDAIISVINGKPINLVN